jgi:hypothetical protein
MAGGTFLYQIRFSGEAKHAKQPRRRSRPPRDDQEESMNYFRDRQTVLLSLPALLLLSGCGGAGPECESSDTRNAVVEIVSGDSNYALADYAAKNSSAVQARVNNASTEAEK